MSSGAKRLSERDRRFFTETNFGHLATLSAAGWPQSTVVWLDADEASILINTAAGRVKAINMQRDPRVAVSVTDLNDPYVAISVRGLVTAIEPDPDWSHIDSLSRRYDGVDFERRPGQQRLIFRISPQSIHRYNY